MNNHPSSNWYNSKHRWTYVKIAFNTLSTPTRVYKVAHRGYIISTKEFFIYKQLEDYGLIFR